MTVLVAVASRHGATREIAEEVGETLGTALSRLGDDSRVDVLFAENVYEVFGYEAFVLGSAVYNGHWLDSARRLVIRHHEVLCARPVWLFSSGPAGSRPREDTVDVAALARLCRAYQHRLFAGKLDRGRLRFSERAVAGALGLREGDYRDWEGIRSWAREIASILHASRTPLLTGQG